MTPIDPIHVELEVRLDEIDVEILNVFRKFPTKTFQAHQVRTILESGGIDIGYGELRDRLRVLVIVGILRRENGTKLFRYSLETKKDDHLKNNRKGDKTKQLLGDEGNKNERCN
ncbi:MAG: hypothetical protein M1477_00830 [Candidatus Thermoplasmatota archaeon]|nr:hypothetical protein [Candidatus Thermoplasmatota archaeon]